MELNSLSQDILQTRKTIRHDARRARRSLTQAQQYLAALKLLLRLTKHPLVKKNKHFAFYLPNDGEISPLPLMASIMERGGFCYLPCICKRKSLEFRRLIPGQKMTSNIFNIPEPKPHNDSIPTQKLDVVFLPLVAFDLSGNRLGMGGGYYDRTFANRGIVKTPPALVGLAHQCQHQEPLPKQAWDVPLDYIVTDNQLIKISAAATPKNFS